MSRTHRAKRRVKRRRPRIAGLPPVPSGAFLWLAISWGWILAGAFIFVVRSRVDQLLLVWLAGPVLIYVAVCRLAAAGLRRIEDRMAERLQSGQLRLAAVLLHVLLFIILYVLLVNPVGSWLLNDQGLVDGAAAFGTFMINFVIIQAVVTALARDDLITRIRSFLP